MTNQTECTLAGARSLSTCKTIDVETLMLNTVYLSKTKSHLMFASATNVTAVVSLLLLPHLTTQ